MALSNAAFPTWLRALLWGIPPAVTILAGLHHGTLFIDDAYITFRYAEKLAAGHGLVFNPGEFVLGTTTPLFAFLLAGLEITGLDLLQSARWLGLLSMAGVVVILQALARRFMPLPIAAALGLCVALHPDTAFTANSGMETGLSMVLVYGSLLLSLRGRYYLAGAVGGAAFLMRPDGVLVVALAAGLVLLREPKLVWQPLIAAAIVVLPWLSYATLTYGSPLPHSVQAKQLIHPQPAWQMLLSLFRSLTNNLPLKLIFGLGSIGAGLALARRSEILLVVLWMAAYTVGLMASGIAVQFPWYFTPLSVGLVLMAAYGAHRIADWLRQRSTGNGRVPEWLHRAAVPVVLLLLAVLCITDVNWRDFRTGPDGNEAAYLEIGHWLEQRCEPGDVVFVGEAGVLSYVLEDQVIIDSSGINSPEVFRFRYEESEGLRKTGERAPSPEGTYRWVTRTIRTLDPTYIVTKYPWLHIGKVEELDWFQEQYVRVMLDAEELREHRVFERRAHGPK